MADEPKKPRGLTPEQWAEARAAFESGTSEAEISKRFGVDRKTIRARKRAEQWIPQVTPHLGKGEADAARERATAKVIDIATKRAVDDAEQAGVVSEIAEAISDELLATRKASKLAAEYTLDILRRAMNGEIEPAAGPGEQTEVDVYKAAMAGYRTFAATVRENAGLRPGQPTIGETKTADDTFMFKVDPDALEAAKQLQAG